MERQVITLTKLTRIEDRLREVIEEVTLYRALTKDVAITMSAISAL